MPKFTWHIKYTIDLYIDGITLNADHEASKRVQLPYCKLKQIKFTDFEGERGLLNCTDLSYNIYEKQTRIKFYLSD